MMRLRATMASSLALVAALMPQAHSDEIKPPLAAEAQTNRWPAITSHSRSFIVAGMPQRDALEVSVWAESVREKLSVWTGVSGRAPFTYPLVIAGEMRPDDPRGWVMKAVDVGVDGYLRQELTMVNPPIIDQDDVLEVLTGMLIDRWLFGMQRPTRGEGTIARVPDWLAVGVARNLYPELRDQDSSALGTPEQELRGWQASSLFEMRTMPAGRWPEKALAGMVVGWLAEASGPGSFMNHTAKLVAQNRSIAADDFFEMARVENAREFNMAWDTWRTAQGRRIVPGRWSSDTIRMERILELRPEDFGLVYPGLPEPGRLTPDMLLKARREEWAQTFSRRAVIKLGEVMLGQEPSLVEVTKSYIGFFNGISKTASGARKISDKKLLAIWAEATAGLERFKATRDAREAMMESASWIKMEGAGPDTEVMELLLDYWESKSD